MEENAKNLLYDPFKKPHEKDLNVAHILICIILPTKFV